MFNDFLNQNRILFRHSYPYTHHQNGLVERKHRHIVGLGLTLLAQANLPFKFWWDAVHTTIYHINRLPTLILNLISPYEKLFAHKPDYTFLKCFGCLCYPYLRDFNKHKFDFYTSKCIFIGYSPSHKGYKCLTISGKIHILRHVIFDETVFPYSTDNSFNLSQPNKDSETPVSVSNFSPQQVYHLSTLSLPHNNFEDVYSASSAGHQQTPSMPIHTDIPCQQEQGNYTLSESSSFTLPSQNSEPIQTQPANQIIIPPNT